MILTILLSFMLLMSPAAYADDLQAGDEAPDFRLMTLRGEVTELYDYRDSILVLIYWNPENKRSALALNDAQDIFKKYGKKGVQFAGITADADNKDAIQNIISTDKIELPILLDNERRVYNNYQIRVYPTTVIIDKEGKLSYLLPGHPLTYAATLENHIRLALGEIDKDSLAELLSNGKENVDEHADEAERIYNLALEFAGSGLSDKAIEAVKQSIESKSDMAKSHILLGFLLLRNKEADRAFACFNKAIELEPDSKDAKTGLGEVYILKNELDKAVEILTSAAEANPYSQMAYYDLGRVYELKGEKDKSIAMYKKAVHKILEKNLLPSSFSKCK